MAEIQAHEAILFNSIISTAVQDELKQELKRLGYTDLAPSHFMLLYVVYKNGGRIQIKCICDTMQKQKDVSNNMNNFKKIKNLKFDDSIWYFVSGSIYNSYSIM